MRGKWIEVNSGNSFFILELKLPNKAGHVFRCWTKCRKSIISSHQTSTASAGPREETYSIKSKTCTSNKGKQWDLWPFVICRKKKGKQH